MSFNKKNPTINPYESTIPNFIYPPQNQRSFFMLFPIMRRGTSLGGKLYVQLALPFTRVKIRGKWKADAICDALESIFAPFFASIRRRVEK